MGVGKRGEGRELAGEKRREGERGGIGWLMGEGGRECGGERVGERGGLVNGGGEEGGGKRVGGGKEEGGRERRDWLVNGGGGERMWGRKSGRERGVS